jgi:hypothetical protein
MHAEVKQRVARLAAHGHVFGSAGSIGEAYQTLLDHQVRDTRRFQWLGLCGGLLFATAMLWPEQWRFLCFVGGASIFQSMMYFIDMSNRNFLLHLIDYYEAKESRGARPFTPPALMHYEREAKVAAAE